MHILPAFITLVEGASSRWRGYRSKARTRRAIDGLSHHLRKDIGWPDPLPERPRRRPPGECAS